MKELIQEMLGMKVTTIVKAQIKNGVPNIPLEQMGELKDKFNAIDTSKLRGVLIITASDQQGENGDGVGIETMFAGTQQIMDALMELQAVRLSMVASDPKVKRFGPGHDGSGTDRCEHRGDVHRPTEHFDDVRLDDLLNFGRGPRRPGAEFDPLLGMLAALALGPMKRRF